MKKTVHCVEKSLNSVRLNFEMKALNANLCFCLTEKTYVLIVVVEPSLNYKQLIFYLIN